MVWVYHILHVVLVQCVWYGCITCCTPVDTWIIHEPPHPPLQHPPGCPHLQGGIEPEAAQDAEVARGPGGRAAAGLTCTEVARSVKCMVGALGEASAANSFGHWRSPQKAAKRQRLPSTPPRSLPGFTLDHECGDTPPPRTSAPAAAGLGSTASPAGAVRAQDKVGSRAEGRRSEGGWGVGLRAD